MNHKCPVCDKMNCDYMSPNDAGSHGTDDFCNVCYLEYKESIFYGDFNDETESINQFIKEHKTKRAINIWQNT